MGKKVKKLVPELRFSEFEGDWEEKRLEKLFSEFKSGFGIVSDEIFEIGSYPVFGGNGLRGYAETYTHEGFYFLIGRQGALCGNINRTNGKGYISEHAIACKANETSNTEWLAQRLDYYNLNRLSESSAQPGLSVKKLLRFKLFVPKKREQEKIASFLDSVTLRISQLHRKRELLETYKKGAMQKIFSQQIRFRQDNGKPFPDWEKKKLGDVFTRITRKNTENNTNVLTNSAQYGLINQRDFFNKSVAAKDLTGYYLLKRGDFAYNKSYSNGYPMGAIKRLHLYDKGVVSTLYICFTNSNKIEAKFYEQYFDGGFLNRELSKIAQEGARNHGFVKYERY